MGSSDWKNWMLGLVIVLGLCFEAFKLVPHSSTVWESDPFATLTAAIRPVNGRSKSARQNTVVSHRQPAPQARPAPTPVAAPNTGAAPLEALEMTFNEGKGSEQTVAQTETTDDTTKKKKKKKKKKKHDDAVQEEVLAKEDLPKPDKKKSDGSHPWPVIPSASSQIFTTTTTIAPNAGKDDTKKDNQVSAEEWIKLLTESPTPANRAKLVAAYKSHAMNPATFYKIEDALLADPKVEVRELAVDALGDTPSVTSFIMLAELSQDAKTEASIKTKADTSLDAYADVKHLSYLRQVMDGSSNSGATVLAAQKLEDAIKTVSTPTQPPTGQPQTQDTTGKAYVSYFIPFVTVLEKLQKSTDAAVAQQATQTLASLQTYLQTNAANTAAL